MACSQSKKVVDNSVITNNNTKDVQQSTPTHIFKMGLISYEANDVNPDSAKNMIERMRSQLEYDVVYNDNSVATLMYDEAGTLKYRSLFTFKNRQLIEYLYTPENNYYTIVPQVKKTAQDSVFFSQIFKVDPSKRKNLHGYDCYKITIMDPIVPGKELSVAYIAEDIPYITKGFGELGKLVNGLPLETSMKVQGVDLLTGAIEHKTDVNMSQYLLYDFDNFTELNPESYNHIKEKY